MDIYDQLLEVHLQLEHDEMWLTIIEGYFEEHEVDNMNDLIDIFADAGIEGAVYTLLNEGDNLLSLKETDEWFDEVTVKRNMKSLRSNNEQFMKTVNEVSKLQQRLESLYEEMGHTLSRYYEIK